MVDQDFFSFCTTLKTVELKAIGQLSRVVHLSEGEMVYSASDPGDRLYIINRGMVEVVLEPSLPGTTNTYLSRGDIFGDIEALSGMPRTHGVRIREEVSLQCFRSDDFTDLALRVPTFFRYLCEQMAIRMVQTRELAVSKSHCLELSGSLGNFDLITIYQTIASSLQTGELSILDEAGRPIASFFFERGRPSAGQLQHLTGREAFWQLFQSDTLPGTFSFHSGDEALGQSVHADIPRSQSDLLIEALQGRDELHSLRARLPDKSMMLRRRKLNFHWARETDPELQSIAEKIWQIAYNTPLSLDAICKRCAFCELKVYRVLDELVRTELFALISPNEVNASEELIIETTTA
jgi:CRP-like cAMP-binding protein